MTAPQTTSASYEVGYRKPPRHSQFQKGQSGNPGGRPRRSPARRLEELALYEAYRTTIVMEDGHAMPMPVIQAVLRRQLECAAGIITISVGGVIDVAIVAGIDIIGVVNNIVGAAVLERTDDATDPLNIPDHRQDVTLRPDVAAGGAPELLA